MAAAFWQTQLDDAQAILASLSAAILALSDPTVTAYTLDTGQSTQRVTRENLPDLLKQRRALMNEIVTIEARCTGSGVTHGRPVW